MMLKWSFAVAVKYSADSAFILNSKLYCPPTAEVGRVAIA
jgi:hypothetical protein